MLRAVYRRYGGPEVMGVDEAPSPVPKKGQVLIRATSSSVNGGDVSARAGKAKPMTALLTRGWPKPLGMDVVGHVSALGEGVTDLQVGDLVWGVSVAFDALAEYVVMPASRLSPVPTGLDPVAAGALPVAGTTAIGAVELAEVHPGDKVLVRGGAGGVGSAIVQIAHARGAVVTALASDTTRDAVLGLGADEVLDHRATAAADLPEFDAVIDTVGRNLEPFRRRLAPGGRFVTITTDMDHPVKGVWTTVSSARFRGQRIRLFSRLPKTAQMQQVADAVTRGGLKPVIDRTFPLAEISEAHARAAEHGTVGKVVVDLAAEA